MKKTQTINDARWERLLVIEKELASWALQDEEEEKRMKSIRRAITKYLDYLELEDLKELDEDE